MGKLGWILVLVLLFLLFHERISEGVDSLTRPSTSPYYGAPPPGPGYYSSPPTAPHSSVTDVLNNLISGGVAIYNGVVKSAPPRSGGALNYGAGPGEDGGYG
ncbi:MAG: hypothetical protein ACJ8GN_02100 [Longimicrobiaceae bacterium]